MQTHNYLFKSEMDLQKWIVKNKLKKHENILIQVFTGRVDKQWINDLRKQLLFSLPQAKIIGVTTDGEILSGRVTTGKRLFLFLFLISLFRERSIFH